MSKIIILGTKPDIINKNKKYEWEWIFKLPRDKNYVILTSEGRDEFINFNKEFFCAIEKIKEDAVIWVKGQHCLENKEKAKEYIEKIADSLKNNNEILFASHGWQDLKLQNNFTIKWLWFCLPLLTLPIFFNPTKDWL